MTTQPHSAESIGAGPDPSVQHSMLQTLFLHAMGGPIDTGGLGAVALRCDHGLSSFRDKILPAVRSRSIKVSQAYNPRNWHYPENQGVRAEELNTWVEAGDVEIWNHTANHWGVESRTAAHDQIVGGLAEIQQQLPAAKGNVWGFNPPSVSKGDYLGFRNGARPAQWGTYVGRLILRHHAISSAYLPGTVQRVLDGKLRDGLSHITIERLTPEALKEHVDEAVTRRTGLQFMIHPSQLDIPGKLTTDGFLEVLEHIVSRREQGRLVTLSPYELTVADSTRLPGADSLWQEISVPLRPGQTQSLRARRRPGAVDLSIDALHADSRPGSVHTAILPPPLRPGWRQHGVLQNDLGQHCGLTVDVDGTVTLQGASPDLAYRGNLTIWR